MKKTLLFLLLFIAVGIVFAQTYLINEGFENASFPPTGWTNNPSGCVRSRNNPRTGVASLAFNGVADAIYTPVMSNPNQLSFWYKRSSNSTAWTLNVQTSTDASNWSSIGTITNATTTYQQFTYDLSSLSNIYIRLLDQRGTETHERYVDDFTVTARSSSPAITVDPSSLTGFTYVYGLGPSSEKTFSLSGSNLTANLTVSVTSNYQIASTSGGTFGSSLSYTPSSGSVSATVYVIQVAGLAIGGSYTGTVTCSSTNATDQTVSLSGAVTTPPPPSAPTATAASNVGSSGFRANWETVSGATGYEVDVYSGDLVNLVNTGFEGSTSFPDGWTQYSSYVQNNSTIAHTGTNYAGMNLADDYIYTPQISDPEIISFWVSASSATANNSTIVQYSADGSNWTNLATYSANGTDTGDVKLAWSQKTINCNLSGDYYIRWFMSARSAGSQYFDDVLITSGNYTYVMTGEDAGNQLYYDVTGLDASTTYKYVVRAYHTYGTSANSNEIEVTTSAPEVVVNADGSATGADIEDGGAVPESLLGTDLNVPAVLYTITATGIRNVVVYKTAAFTGDWYCWLDTPAGLVAGSNPIGSSTPSYTFNAVNFDAKGDVVVIINDNSTLPVELSSFTATITSSNMVSLQWITQSETNLNGFYVNRSSSLSLGDAIVVSPLIDATNTSNVQAYSFNDDELMDDGTYYYWLQVQEMDGSMEYHGPISVIYSNDNNPGNHVVTPVATEITGIYPNPFNPSATIRYALTKDAQVNMVIFNARGQIVRIINEGMKTVGTHPLIWDGKDSFGNSCSTGVYFFKMQAGSVTSIKKAVLVK